MYSELMSLFLLGGVMVYLTIFAFVFFVLMQKKRAKDAADFLEDTLNTPDQGLIIFDKKDNFCMANDAARKFLPFLDNAIQHPNTLSKFFDYAYDNAVEFDESLRGALDKASSHLDSMGFREVIKWENDKVCLVEARKTKGDRTILTLIDVSNIKKQEETFIKLNDYSHELTEAVEAATNGIIITAIDQSNYPIIFVNNAFCDYAGMSREEIIGQDIRVIIKKTGDEGQRKIIYKALDNLKSADLETSIVKGRETRWFNLKLTPVDGRAGRSGLFIGVFTDTSELKYREAEFFKAQKLEALGQLAAGIAHDFNNLLSIVDGYARLAAKGIDEDDPIRDYLIKIRTATKRGADLTRQMLTFSRHKISVKSVIDLSQVVKDQEALLMPLLDASIKLSVHADSGNFYIECAPDTISRILMNLVINGRDAMQGGGALIVDIQNCPIEAIPKSVIEKIQDAGGGEDSFVCLSVSDTGTGMDKAIQEKVFDPFFTTKDQGQGTGLGLSMVYGMVNQMGGYIDLRSSPGQGTVISIYIPLTDQEPSKKALDDVMDIDAIDLKGYTVIVAEDEPDLLILVCDMLEKLGMEVIHAKNGNDALLKQEDYDGDIDLLLTDVVMPELNGVKLAALFMSIRPEIKVIFMSGYPDSGKLAKMELPEGAYFMAKPVQYEELTKLVFSRLSEKEGDESGTVVAMPSAHWKTDSKPVDDSKRETP